MAGPDYILVSAEERQRLKAFARERMELAEDIEHPKARASALADLEWLWHLADRPGIPAAPQREDPVTWALTKDQARRLFDMLSGRVADDEGQDCDDGGRSPWSIEAGVRWVGGRDCKVGPATEGNNVHAAGRVMVPVFTEMMRQQLRGERVDFCGAVRLAHGDVGGPPSDDRG